MPPRTTARTPDDSSPKASGVVCFDGQEEHLSTEEKAFNRLTARIKDLQVRIETAERENLALDQYYLVQFRPAMQALGEALMELALRLEEAAARRRAGKVRSRQLKRVIPALLREAFQFAEPTAEAMVLQDAYSHRSDQILQEEAEAKTGEAVLEVLPEAGFAVPPERRRGSSDPQTKDAFAEELAVGAGRPTHRKSRKQLEREAQERRKEGLKQRSLRDVYIALAKVLHPDAESDPGRKAEKEAFLKRVTAAYREGNLVELLHLEMAWLEGGGLRNAPADKLALYVEVLKDQAKALEVACSRAENAFREAYPTFTGTIGAFRRVLAKDRAAAEIERVRLKRLTTRLEADPGLLEDCLDALREDFQ